MPALVNPDGQVNAGGEPAAAYLPSLAGPSARDEMRRKIDGHGGIHEAGLLLRRFPLPGRVVPPPEGSSTRGWREATRRGTG